MKYLHHIATKTAAGPATGRARASGFTLIELMVVIGITGVVLAICIPSFKSVTQRNRISSEVNAFVGDLQFARSEAIRRGMPVSICPSSNGTTCLTTNTWHKGWIVFNDDNATGTPDVSSDKPLRVQSAWTSPDTFVASPSNVALTYSRDGFMTSLTGSVTLKIQTTPVDNSATKCVAVTLVGRQSVLAKGSGTCT